MVDIPSRRVIDIIETRELTAVKEWLKTFPSLRYVSRDGSVTYKSAITQANKKIIQISDRFHLLKGLTDAAKKFITGYFKANIGLLASNSHYDGIKTSFYWKKDTGKIDIPTMKHMSTTKRKMRLAEEAARFREMGYSDVKIARRLVIAPQTVKEYLKPNFTAESANYNTAYPSKIKRYAGDIVKMLSKGKKFREIESVIRKKGYAGSASAIRMFATRERRLLKETASGACCKAEKIERKWLVSLLYKPIDKVTDLTQAQLDKVIDENPIIGNLYGVVKTFKETLFSNKVSKLNAWIKDARLLKIAEIDSFIGGITRDIEAVKNAIKYRFNNGLAEGSVNKLKVIKRIMYGRCNFYLLKNKLLNLENRR
jgi:predicted transcriptional regulator